MNDRPIVYGMGGFKRDREEREKQTARNNCVYNIDSKNATLIFVDIFKSIYFLTKCYLLRTAKDG